MSAIKGSNKKEEKFNYLTSPGTKDRLWAVCMYKHAGSDSNGFKQLKL